MNAKLLHDAIAELEAMASSYREAAAVLRTLASETFKPAAVVKPAGSAKRARAPQVTAPTAKRPRAAGGTLTDDQVLHVIAARKGATLAVICKALDQSYGKVWSRLQRMTTAGVLTVDGQKVYRRVVAGGTVGDTVQ